MGISPAFSTYLDLVRVVCAIAVVFHHYSSQIVGGSAGAFPDVGQEAVMVFFVLSGFIIARVARRLESEPVVFVAKRLARVYPVAIAGVALSYLLYALCGPWDPGLYEGRASEQPWWLEVGLTLTFLNQTQWLPHLMPPTNGAYWSLTCEIWFYVLAGFIFFARPRWALLAILVAVPVLGPNIMLLFPVWLAGVWAERLCDRPRLAPLPAGVLAVVSLALTVVLWGSGARSDWRISPELTSAFRLGRVADFAYFNALAVVLGTHLFAAYNLFTASRRWPAGMTRWLRHAAGTSFCLYAMHFPLLFALRSWLRDEPFAYFYPLVTVALVLTIGRPIENLRVPAYRALLAVAARAGLRH